jgi:hypothetical protein
LGNDHLEEGRDDSCSRLRLGVGEACAGNVSGAFGRGHARGSLPTQLEREVHGGRGCPRLAPEVFDGRVQRGVAQGAGLLDGPFGGF